MILYGISDALKMWDVSSLRTYVLNLKYICSTVGSFDWGTTDSSITLKTTTSLFRVFGMIIGKAKVFCTENYKLREFRILIVSLLLNGRLYNTFCSEVRSPVSSITYSNYIKILYLSEIFARWCIKASLTSSWLHSL